MFSKIKAAALVAASFAALSGAAHASVLTAVGGGSVNIGGVTGTYEDVAGAGLGISGPGNVTFTFQGSGAGYENLFNFAGLTLFNGHTSAVGASITKFVASAGLIPFTLVSGGPGGSVDNGQGNAPSGGNLPLMIAYQLVSPTFAHIYFNDNYPDSNFSDMSVDVKVSAVPVPAALPLMAAGLMGIGALGRRRNRKAKV